MSQNDGSGTQGEHAQLIMKGIKGQKLEYRDQVFYALDQIAKIDFITEDHKGIFLKYL